MPPTRAPSVKSSVTRSIVVIPSKHFTPENLEGVEETEIAAQITLPTEGGWAWVVLFSSFTCIFLMDGVSLTFGSIYPDMVQDLGVSDSLVTFINSIAVSLYMMGGPLASALINRFGFRACAMSGSMLSCFSLVCTYFSTNYVVICIFYGAFAGFGYCLINLSSNLVVGFYFEKLRAMAIALATSGSSVGITIMFPINTYLVKIAGWRVLTLLHSGLLGVVFFLGMTYKPLLSLTVTQTTDDPTKTVTYLPTISTARDRPTSSAKTEGPGATTTEKLFSAVSNMNFPTAAAVVDERAPIAITQPGPSTAAVPKLTIKAQVPQSGISQRQLKQVQSIMSRTSVQDKGKRNMELTVEVDQGIKQKKRKWWSRLCQWEEHVPQARPMYRDDIFYEGKLESLPVYQKSVMEHAADTRTGIEYQLAVSRAVTTADLEEKRGVFTTAVRRVLATMMDPALLKRCSFNLLCMSGLTIYLGLMVPYVFIAERSRNEGIDERHCRLFVSTIGLSNTVGRLVLGALATKIDVINLFLASYIMTGLGTIASNFSFNTYYQYVCCAVFGFFVSSMASLRSIVIVEIYGLEKLTNATGMLLLFQGMGNIVSTPSASLLKNNFGYSVAFYIAGICMSASGLILLPLKKMARREKNESQKPKT